MIRFVTSNWQIKLLSLISAIILWAYVHVSKFDTIKLNLPVNYLNLPTTLTYVKKPPNFVSLYVRGRKGQLQFSISRFKAKVDLTDAVIGTKKYNVVFDTSVLPAGIDIVSISKTTLSIDKKIKKYLWVKVPIKGVIAQGFRKGRLGIIPQRILCVGPETILRNLQYINTTALKVSNHKQTIKQTLSIESYSKYIVPSTSSVQVILNVFKENINNEKRFSGITIKFINAIPNVQVTSEPKTVDFIVQGLPNLLNQLNANAFQAIIDLSKIDSDIILDKAQVITTTVPITPRLTKATDQLVVLDIIPSEVTVSISSIKAKDQTNKSLVSETNNNTIKQIDNSNIQIEKGNPTDTKEPTPTLENNQEEPSTKKEPTKKQLVIEESNKIQTKN